MSDEIKNAQGDLHHDTLFMHLYGFTYLTFTNDFIIGHN